MQSNNLGEKISTWYAKNGRQNLPWRYDISPYRVWISEIMLQQTQVNTAIAYFERFMAKYPDLQTIKKASEDDIYNLWSGLGYYRRASFIFQAKELIHAKFKGEMPDNYDDLVSLPGVGKSTAGAILSIAFNKPYPILDANVKKDLPVIVSGATGGVGSISVGLLSKLGYEVHAVTGKSSEIEILKIMGATEIISRDDYMSEPIKPLDKALYSAAVDTVGGDILAKIISMVSNHGVVSCCGNVGGATFSSSVFPFILRGIQLSGIDSAESSIDLKSELWNLLSDEWSLDLVNQTKTIKIDDVGSEINKILKGDQIGRVVIQHGE